MVTYHVAWRRSLRRRGAHDRAVVIAAAKCASVCQRVSGRSRCAANTDNKR